MKSKSLLLALLMSLVLLVTACGGGSSSQAASTPAGGDTSAAGDGSLAELPADLCEGPVLLTSVGQSADISIVNTLMERAGIDVHQNATVAPDDFDGYNTLVLAIGGSSKGLGAAGIDENEEMDRVKALIEAAQNAGAKIVSLHIGGSSRRGTLSDKFIPDALVASDAAIILSEGDSDNMMRDLLAANNVPAVYITNQMDAIEPLQTLFGE